MTHMTECDEFFAGKATMFVGERAGAEGVAAKAAARLAGAGLAFETVPCLQNEHLQLYHRASLYRIPDEIDRFLGHADWLRRQNPVAVRPRAAAARAAPTGGRIELRDHRHAVETLTPLISRRMRLATRDGRLAFGNWWLGSLDADTFEVASDFGLIPPACGYDQVSKSYSHVILEVWPTGEVGARLDCVRGRPHTTMVYVPFGHDIALHLVAGDGMSGIRDRTDDNLRGVFG